MTTTISGTTGIDKVQDAVVQNATLAAGVPSRAKLPAGTVLQVVSGSYATQMQTSSGSAVSTGLQATITPTSTTSKILVIANLAAVYVAGSGYQASLFLYKDGSNLSFFGQLYGGASAVEANQSAVYLDSPAKNTATTYSIYIAAAIGTVYAQLNNSTSVITLMEIAA